MSPKLSLHSKPFNNHLGYAKFLPLYILVFILYVSVLKFVTNCAEGIEKNKRIYFNLPVMKKSVQQGATHVEENRKGRISVILLNLLPNNESFIFGNC